MSINQKAISVKVNWDIYDDLERENAVSRDSRNRIINKAIRYYLEYLDIYRASRCIGTPGDREALVTAFVDRHFPHWRK